MSKITKSKLFACIAAACAPAQAEPAAGNAAATLGSKAADAKVSAAVTIWNYSPNNLYPTYFRFPIARRAELHPGGGDIHGREELLAVR